MSEPQLAGRRVLVVEDEYFLADEISRGLRAAGAAVVGPAPTVAAAIGLLDVEGGLDAASLDVNLGGETVYPVADRLAARGVPFVFITGYDRAVLPERFAGVHRMEKPVAAVRVVRALGGLLDPAA